MSISGIGTGCPAWRETGKSRRNNSGEDFANRIAGMVNRNDSAGSGKTTAVCGRDNYVSGNAASIYGMGVYSGKERSASQDLPIEREPYKIKDANSVEAVPVYEIVVKPDGSRVLVMTMSVGGMETTMSLEISKPTKAPNQNSKQDTNNDMPFTDAEQDTASDEISNIATED